MTYPTTAAASAPMPTTANPEDEENAAPPEARRPAAARRGWIWLTLALVAGGGAAIKFGALGKDGREELPAASLARRDPAVVVVSAGVVTHRAVQRTVEANGTLHGFEEVTVTAKIEGRVRAVKRDVGDRVKPGDVLIEIEAEDYEQAAKKDEQALQVELAKLGLDQPPGSGFDLTKTPSVVQAQVRRDTAKAKFDRLLQLRSRGSVSTEDIEISSGDFRAAEAEYSHQLLLARAGLATVGLKQAELASSRLKLAETRVLAPTPTKPVPGAEEGVAYAVIARGVAEGTMIRAGTEVCRLVIDRTLKLRVPVPERFSAEISLGQQAEVTTANAATPFAGKVTRINPAVEPTTRTFEVEIQVPNPTGAIKAGGFGKAAILTRRDSGAATVPLSAPYSFAGTTRVFLVENGKAKEVPVTLGVQSTEWVEIASPKLAEGARVVTSGQATLAEGTPISVRETAAAKPAAAPAPPGSAAPGSAASAPRARSGG